MVGALLGEAAVLLGDGAQRVGERAELGAAAVEPGLERAQLGLRGVGAAENARHRGAAVRLHRQQVVQNRALRALGKGGNGELRSLAT